MVTPLVKARRASNQQRIRKDLYVYCLLVYVYVYFCMKKKLTITVDAALLPKAKRYARSQGVSLSSLVEDGLRRLAFDESPSFSARWRGGFCPAERDGPRYEALAKKHL